MEFPKRIAELVLKEASQKFKTADFLDLLRPGVYVFLKDSTPLYIGYSGRLLQRLGFQHHRASVLETSTEILLYPTRTEADAIELEELLIEHLKPTRNIRKSPRGSRDKSISVSTEQTETLSESAESELEPTLA